MERRRGEESPEEELIKAADKLLYGRRRNNPSFREPPLDEVSLEDNRFLVDGLAADRWVRSGDPDLAEAEERADKVEGLRPLNERYSVWYDLLTPIERDAVRLRGVLTGDDELTPFSKIAEVTGRQTRATHIAFHRAMDKLGVSTGS